MRPKFKQQETVNKKHSKQVRFTFDSSGRLSIVAFDKCNFSYLNRRKDKPWRTLPYKVLDDFDTLSTRQVSSLLGVGEKAIRKAVKEQKVPCLDLGSRYRFLVLDIIDYIQSKRTHISDRTDSAIHAGH